MALFSLIREINTGTTKWALRVRLVRMYLNPPRGKKEDTASYEMMFHDEEGDRIQAYMKTGVIKHFKATLEEGSLYAIRNFVVHKNKSGFKITTCEFKLQFHRFTNVIDYENHKFPKKLYKFKDYSEFDCVNDVDENQLVDVIGRVVSYQPPVVASNISTRMDFRIQDLKNKQLTCSIWEEYVDKLLPFLENQTAEPVIISLQFARPKIFRGELKISNTYHITKLTVNGNDDEFLNFRERLNAKGNFSVNKVTSSIYYEIYDIFSQGNARVRTLAYLSELEEVSEYWVDATIVDIETTDELWYLACKNCAHKINAEDGSLKCGHCKELNKEETYRYKIEVMVVDQTGGARILLWNKACLELIGVPANEMKQQHESNANEVQKFIEEALIDKNVLFEVNVSSDKKMKIADF